MTKTVAIDFDGVIHKYSKGWQDGAIYDVAIDGSISAINALLKSGYSVFIFSTRDARQIKKWLKELSNPLLYMSQADFMDYYYPMVGNDYELFNAEYNNEEKLQYKIQSIPFWKKFWNKKNILGITKRKLPAHCYLDDRAIVFDGDWDSALQNIITFKTYQNG